MDKTFILDEIKRTATANGGSAPGRQRFRNETGIRPHEWGKFWRAWGDALVEAGLTPNQFTPAYDKSHLLKTFAELARTLGRIPTKGDILVARNSGADCPSERRFWERFGSKAQLVAQLADFCRNAGGYDDILQMCEQYSPPKRKEKDENGEHEAAEFGYVYLIKSGRHHKTGKTNAVGRRERELAIQLPEKSKTIHVISTDDPAGIEAYWHNRFREKRLNGEWFDLSASDVTAFKRRKFM